MAAPAVRASGITTTVVLQRASIASDYHSSASSLVSAHNSVMPSNSESLDSPAYLQEVAAELTLVNKKCTPCSSKDLQPLAVESAKSLLEQEIEYTVGWGTRQIPGWDLLDIDGKLQLQKSWKAKNFVKGLEFIQTIADVAESEGHHPDLHLVNWNNVKANIWTHSIGGLTENDFILAAKINTLSGDRYLRKSFIKSAPKSPTVAS